MLETIADTRTSTRTIDSAGAVIDYNHAYVHVLPDRLQTAMVAAAEPRPHGPPPTGDLTHHVHVLACNGDSYRLADAKRRRAKPATKTPETT